MTIFLIRHGKDEDGFRGGWSQRKVVEEGIQQSKKLGAYLKKHKEEFNIHRIISSDLARAFETAEYISDALQLPIEKSKVWRETNNGMLAGMPNDEANKKFPGLYFNILRMDERYPGGESPNENFKRIKKTFEDICKEQIKSNGKENVLVVTHGGVISIIYHIVKKKEWTNKNKPFPASNTGVHRIDYIKENWEITQENIVEHLN